MKKGSQTLTTEDGEVVWKEYQKFAKKEIRDGLEYPDQTPVEVPIGYSHPPSIHELISQMVRQEVQMREEMGEDVDEAEREEDFEVDEEGEELLTPYELWHTAATEKEQLVRQGALERKKGKSPVPAKQAEGLEKTGGGKKESADELLDRKGDVGGEGAELRGNEGNAGKLPEPSRVKGGKPKV